VLGIATAAVLVVGLGIGGTAQAGGTTQVLPYEGPTIVRGRIINRGHKRLAIIFKRLQLNYGRAATPPAGLHIGLHCVGCPSRQSSSKRFVSPAQMRGQIVPVHATLIVVITKPGWIGLYIRLRSAGTESPGERVLCLVAGARRPSACPSPPIPHIPTVLLPPPPPTSPVVTAAPKRPVADREAVTSIDGTRGDRAPYSGEFSDAYQPFTAAGNRVTYVGATIGNPNVPVGRSSSDKLTLRLCEAADCSSGTIASGTELVNNYGMTTVGMSAEVVSGHTYYLVWAPPENSHGGRWLAFWHGGGPTISASREMEAIIRGYEHNETGPQPKGPRSVIDYAGAQPPPAPYSGPFLYGFQAFKAASDTITKIGVVVGNPAFPRDATGSETMTLRLCQVSDCSSGVLAAANPSIVNYGLTEADIGDVSVTPGQTYFVYWQSPRRAEGQSWVSFWQGQGPHIEESRLMQAFARGYDREGGASPPNRTEQVGYLGAPTFENPGNASGEGPRITPLSFVEVSCKLYAPQIESSEPDGYWYLISSPPWSGHYYAVANTFWNGVGPGEGGEPINTDLELPNCA
jgi:hypothetical protein